MQALAQPSASISDLQAGGVEFGFQLGGIV
jgi:hypothetical protein